MSLKHIILKPNLQGDFCLLIPIEIGSLFLRKWENIWVIIMTQLRSVLSIQASRQNGNMTTLLVDRNTKHTDLENFNNVTDRSFIQKNVTEKPLNCDKILLYFELHK